MWVHILQSQCDVLKAYLNVKKRGCERSFSDGGPCWWVNTFMKYVFSSFTLSSSVSVIEP